MMLSVGGLQLSFSSPSPVLWTCRSSCFCPLILFPPPLSIQARKPRGWIMSEKERSLCLADPSPPLSSMLLISKKAVNLKWASKCSFSLPFRLWNMTSLWVPEGGKGHEYSVFLKPLSRRGQRQLFPFQNSRQVSKMFIHVNILKHQNRDYLTS